MSKTDLKTIIDQTEKQENEFAQVKLRKVKVERIKEEKQKTEDFDSNAPKSIKDLMKMFNNPGKDTNKPAFRTVKTIVEEGNVAPGQAFKSKKGAAATSGETATTGKKSGDKAADGEDEQPEEVAQEVA